MNRLTLAGLTAALLLGASATAMAQDGHGRADYGTEGEGTEASGYGNVDIYEQGRFRMRDKRDYENLVIIGPRILPPGVAIRYDRLLSDRISVLAGVGYGAIGSGDTKISRIEGMLGMNWHPIGNGMHGFFVGPRLKINQWGITVTEGESGADGSVTAISAGAVAGWRWIWDPGFSLGLGLGGQYITVASEAAATYEDGTEADTGSYNFDGFVPAFEFTLGWAF